MLKPKKNFVITGFFAFYIDWIIKRHFYKVEYNTPKFNKEQSILLIANHFSWWDGFLLYYVNKLVFKKRFHVMVLEESMRKMGFLKYLGSFSVVKNSRQVLESLDYAAGLLGDPNNIVVIFPQGKLYSNFVDTLSFEKGILHIAAKAKANFQYIFAANFTENFEHKKPTAHIYLKALNVDEIKPDEIKEQYMRHYQTAKQQQTSIIV